MKNEGDLIYVSPAFVHGNLSEDGMWLALPLMDGSATNIWAVPTTGPAMRGGEEKPAGAR